MPHLPALSVPAQSLELLAYLSLFDKHVQPFSRGVVQSGCEAIIAHVTGLKELVDAFHQYARMPTVSPRPASLSRNRLYWRSSGDQNAFSLRRLMLR